MIERTARFVVRHRVAVVAVWVLLAGTAWIASRGLSELLTNRFSLPGTETERVEQILLREYGVRSDGGFTLVAERRGQPTVLLARDVRRAAERAAAAVPSARVARVERLGPGVVAAAIPTGLEPGGSSPPPG